MSAPDTNLKKQKRRHKGPLVGMTIAVLLALALLIGLVFNVIGGDTQTDEVPPSVEAEGETGIVAPAD